MIPRLPYWILTEKKPAFYETESKTAVEMVAKVYGKMQELVDDYNSFVDQINLHIEEYETGVNQDFETFKENITKTIHDYIQTIDMKIAHQDRVIDEAIKAMVENLKDTVTVVLKELQETGELEQAIINAFDNLGARVITLETSVSNLEVTLEQEVQTLNTKIETEKQAINTKIETEKQTLNEKIDSEKQTLNERIDTEKQTLNEKIDTEKQTLNERIDSIHLYSNNEVVIGKWVNGKPLYRKVFTGTTPNSTANTKIGTIVNMEKLIGISGIIGEWFPINAGLTGELIAFVSKDAYSVGDIYMEVGKTNFNKSYVVVCEYTKSTDSAS